jgi:hypothetical protein
MWRRGMPSPTAPMDSFAIQRSNKQLLIIDKEAIPELNEAMKNLIE